MMHTYIQLYVDVYRMDKGHKAYSDHGILKHRKKELVYYTGTGILSILLHMQHTSVAIYIRNVFNCDIAK